MVIFPDACTHEQSEGGGDPDVLDTNGTELPEVLQ